MPRRPIILHKGSLLIILGWSRERLGRLTPSKIILMSTLIWQSLCRIEWTSSRLWLAVCTRPDSNSYLILCLITWHVSMHRMSHLRDSGIWELTMTAKWPFLYAIISIIAGGSHYIPITSSLPRLPAIPTWKCRRKQPEMIFSTLGPVAMTGMKR